MSFETERIVLQFCLSIRHCSWSILGQYTTAKTISFLFKLNLAPAERGWARMRQQRSEQAHRQRSRWQVVNVECCQS